MTHPSENPSSKPSLEALLRFKRAERPDDAFWSDFDARLRQRQLAAIIEPKPWWLGPTLVLRRFSLPAVLVTSGAAAALTFVVVRNGAPFTDQPGFAAASALPSDVSVVAIDAEAPSAAGVLSVGDPASLPAVADRLVMVAAIEPVSVAEEAGSEVVAPVMESTDSVLADNMMVAAVESSVSATLSGEVLASDDVLVVPVLVAATTSSVPFEVAARDLASVSWSPERVELQDVDFAGLATIGGTDSFVFNAGDSASVDDALPVAVVPAPGSRFERLLSADAAKVAGSDGTLAQVRDRVLHHLSRDEERYASISRVGVGGDRLSLRF